MKKPLIRRASLILLAAAGISPVGAVIVAGANGGSDTSNNTSLSQLENAIGDSFPVFDNVIRYSDASGVYLGYDPDTFDIWVLTARHVADSNASIVIDGLSYTHQQRIIHTTLGDLELNRYSRVDLQVPGLPAVALATSTPTVGTQTVMIGLGVNRVASAATDANTGDDTLLPNGQRGYEWGLNSSWLKRWGLNHVDLFPNESTVLSTLPTIFNTTAFSMDFDLPGAGEWLSSNEGIGALGDSGGGAFIFDGTQWVLAGIFSAATRGDQNDNDNFTDDRFSNYTGTGGYYGGTFATDIATYRDVILGFTGTLIPEPSSCALLFLSASSLLLRKRR